MAKIKFSLHPIAAEIRRAQKKLRALRSKVTKADQKKIDLNLRVLEKSYRLIAFPCPRPREPQIPPFGQTFTSNG
jgi:hypothetical protein